jgi:hypothetical protein
MRYLADVVFRSVVGAVCFVVALMTWDVYVVTLRDRVVECLSR